MKKRILLYNYILAAVIPALSMLLILVICGIVPFGDNTFLINDMKREYADFYLYYRSVLEGRNDFLYSLSAGPGENMLGLFAYFLTSPLLLLMAFVDVEHLPLFLSFLLCVKVLLFSLSVCFFLHYYLEKELRLLPEGSMRPLLIPVFSSGCALSGYMMENITNTMWIDALIWMPIFFVCGLRLLASDDSRRKLRAVLLSFSTAVLIYLNFYIAYMILLFALIFVILCDAPVRRKTECAFSVATGAALSAFLTLPAFLSLSGGSRVPSVKAFHMTAGNLSPLQALSRMFFLSFDPQQIFFGVPALFPCMLFLPFLVPFFLEMKIPRKNRRTAAVLLLLLLASFCFEPLNALWHGGALPNGYNYRFAFLFLFVLAVCAVRACLLPSAAFPRRLSAGLILTASLAMAAGLLRFSFFSPRKVLLNLFLLGFFYVLVRAAGASHRTGLRAAHVSVLAVAVCLILMIGNGVYIYRTGTRLQESQSAYLRDTARIASALKEVSLPADGNLYRIESVTRRSENDAIAFSYPGISLYSSLQHMAVRRFIARLGFDDTGLYTVYEDELPHVQDTVLAIAGSMVGSSFDPSEALLPVIFRLPFSVDVLAARSDQVLAHEDDPFLFSEEILRSYLPEDSAWERVFVPADFRTETLPLSDAAPHRMRCVITPARDGEIYFYICGIRDEAHDYSFTRDGWPTVTYGSRSSMRVIDLGHHRAGETFSFLLEGSEPLPVDSQLRLFTENDEALCALVAGIPRGESRTAHLSSSHLYAAAQGAGALVLAIPYDRNWRCLVDGKAVSPVCLFDAYMALPLDGEGFHAIDLQYVPAGLPEGCAISLITLIVLTLALLFPLLKNHSRRLS